MRERGSGTRQVAEQLLAERGVDPDELRVVVELGTGEAVSARSRVAWALRCCLGRSPRRRLLLAPSRGSTSQDPPIVRPFYTLLPKGTPTRAAEAFAEYLAETAPK